MKRNLSRRTLLRGFLQGGLVTVGLPPLEIFFNTHGTALACGGSIPRRFGLYFWGNGNIPDFWTPAGEGSDWTLSEQLMPLADVQSRISVLTGLSVKLPNDDPHDSGSAGLLTGLPLEKTGDSSTFGGPTIDQIIAQQVGDGTIYRSLQTAATDCNGLSYNGPNSRNPPETSPFAFYERIFGSTFRAPGEEGIVDPTLALRRSALDAVMDDIHDLRRDLGTADRLRLEQHLEGVRELEQRLALMEEDPPNLEACERPGAPLEDYPDEEGRAQISARSRAMCDLIAMALACDQTRVFAHYLTDPLTDVLFPGASAGHHDLTHNEGGDQPEVNAITIQCMEEFAYLVQALDAVPEADGTLLDNCAVLACSETSLGQTHSIDEMPIIVAGSCCGTLQTGIHYRSYSKENISKLSLSLIRAMDIEQDEFGVDDTWTDEGLSALEV